MKKVWIVLCALLFIPAGSGRARADTAAILKEVQSLKERIEELEQKLEEKEILAKRQAAKTEKQIGEKIEETLGNRFGTLSLHGGAVLYYQDSRVHQLEGENADSPSGAGFTGDLELTWKPGVPVFENGATPACMPARAPARTGAATPITRSTCCSPTSTPSPTTTPARATTPASGCSKPATPMRSWTAWSAPPAAS